MKRKKLTHDTERPDWCGWPDKEYAREIDDLYAMGAACDAWRLFLTSRSLTEFKRLKGYFGWFQQHDFFSKLNVECDCSEKRLRRVIYDLRLFLFQVEPYKFLRNDIYDSRAWAVIPLRHFVEVDTRVEPMIHFGLRLPWTVSASCFKMIRRTKRRKQLDTMVFIHPQIDGRFGGQRWCADRVYVPGVPVAERFAALLDDVREQAAKYLVTIED